MHRAVPVLAATAGSIALLANFHTSPERATLTASAAPLTPSTEPAPTPTTTTTIVVTKRSAPSTTATPVTTATRTIVGPNILTRFGDVQVRIVLVGSRLQDVQALRLPDSHERSVEISNFAAPRLRQEALQAQSARINLISGATYTSEGYIESLQAALNARR